MPSAMYVWRVLVVLNTRPRSTLEDLKKILDDDDVSKALGHIEEAGYIQRILERPEKTKYMLTNKGRNLLIDAVNRKVKLYDILTEYDKMRIFAL